MCGYYQFFLVLAIDIFSPKVKSRRKKYREYIKIVIVGISIICRSALLEEVEVVVEITIQSQLEQAVL